MWLEPNFRRRPETEIFGLAQLQRQMWVNLNWNSERNVVSVFTGNGKISVWFRSTVNVNFKIKHFPAFTCKTFISWGSQDIYTGNSKELQPRVWNCILQDFSWNSNDWKIVINNKATHDEVFFSPVIQKVTLFDSSDHLLNQQQQRLDKTYSSDKTLKSFIQSPLLHLSFLFENAKRTSCLTKTSLPQIMLNECWQA